MKSKKFYTSKTDRVFKAIFCDEDYKHMMKILSSILERDVTELTFLNNELAVSNVEERQKIVDVLAKVDGEYIPIELNSNAINYLMSKEEKMYVDNLEIIEFNMDGLKKYCYKNLVKSIKNTNI